MRIDRWLWAVRIYKTRTLATDACRAGHVRVNGVSAKAASLVRRGDVVTIRSGGLDRILEVVEPLEHRVAAALAVQAFVDRSPVRPSREAPAPFERERGAGRPTKRDRRVLDRLRGP